MIAVIGDRGDRCEHFYLLYASRDRQNHNSSGGLVLVLQYQILVRDCCDFDCRRGYFMQVKMLTPIIALYYLLVFSSFSSSRKATLPILVVGSLSRNS